MYKFMINLSLVLLITISLSSHAMGSISGSYRGILGNGDSCSIDIDTELNTATISYSDSDEFKMKINKELLTTEKISFYNQKTEPIYFEDSLDYTTAKLKLYISSDLKLQKAEMKISFFPTFYKDCENIRKI